MTVASSTSKVTFNGNGVTTSWPFDFPVKDGSHIQVIVTSPAGVETTLFNGYTVTLNSNGGVVIYPTSGAPLAAGHKITLRRVVPLTQETDLANQGGFYAETHEDRFDLLAMVDQQQQEQLDRAVKAPVSDTSPFEIPTATARASRLLGFQSDGRPRASAVTLEAVEAATTASAVAGKVIAVVPPVTSDGALTEVDTGYTLASAAQADVVVGGIHQAGKFIISGTKVVFPEAVTEGEEVHIRILGVSPDAPTGGDVAYTPALPLGAVASGGASPNSAAVDHVHAMPTAAQVGAAATVHAHAVSDTTGLQAALDGKAATTLANVSNLDFANKASAAGVGGGGEGLPSQSGNSGKFLTTNGLAADWAALPIGSETVSGIVELATTAEAQAGSDTARAVTPAVLASVTATETRAGLVELATTAETTTGTDTTRAVTPAGVAAAIAASGGGGGSFAMSGVTEISSNYTVISADAGKLLRCTAALTLTLTSAATLGAGFIVGVRSETSGDVGITYSGGGSSINGYPARLILRPGQSIWLVSDGTGWRSIGQQSLSDYTWDRGIANGWLTLSADGYVGATPSGSGFVGYSWIRTAVPIPTDKVYWEMRLDDNSSTERHVGVSGITGNAPVGSSPTGWEYNLVNGQKVHNSVGTSFGASVGTADIVGVACHIASGKIWFAKNNVWQASGNPSAGTSPAFDNLSGNLYVAASVYYYNQWIYLYARRSQQTYAPPSGFAPLAG